MPGRTGPRTVRCELASVHSPVFGSPCCTTSAQLMYSQLSSGGDLLFLPQLPDHLPGGWGLEVPMEAEAECAWRSMCQGSEGRVWTAVEVEWGLGMGVEQT